MNHLLIAWVVFALLSGCAITHYEARGEFGDTPAVVHWKEGDSALTLWRCGAVPIALTRGITGQENTFASNDDCVRFHGSLEPGASTALGVYCNDPRYPEQGKHALADMERWRQLIWFGRTDPAIPDPC